MTIEIQRPELEALILERMQTGGFESIEDVLFEALKAAPVPLREGFAPQNERSLVPTGTDLVAAMQASPFKEVDLEPPRSGMPVREIAC